MRFGHKILLFVFAVLFSTKAFSQTQTDSLINRINAVAKDVDVMKRLKFSGYIQAQFQDADSAGIRSFEGGDFPTGSDKRFMIRRGRLKASYTANITEIVLQLDATERGV